MRLASVRAIRSALEEIPGAIRYEDPLSEPAGAGSDPATEIWISNPDPDIEMFDAPSVRPDDELDGAVSDEPEVIFEVPLGITDADVKRVLGEERVRELERLQQLRGIDAP